MSQDQQIAVAQDLLDRLIDLNIRLPDEYDEVALVATITVGSDGSDYRSLVCEIVTLLKRLQKQSQAKDGVNLQVRSDVEHFHSDLVTILQKLDYGYQLPESLCAASSFFDKFRPIDFLAAELQASLLLKLDGPEDEMDVGDETLYPQSEKVATQLFMMETTLHIPSGSLTLLERVESLVGKVKQIVSNVPQPFLGKPLVSFKQLNSEQKGLLQSIYEALDGEYATRRKMLLTRFDTTVKSFYYSAKAEVNLTVALKQTNQQKKTLIYFSHPYLPIFHCSHVFLHCCSIQFYFLLNNPQLLLSHVHIRPLMTLNIITVPFFHPASDMLPYNLCK
eukprot:TRINITY_DN3731_c0_g1_i2.p1 TRINITY_DN3731_c0_g1~~TRINITY_DN3731_c0_g1_i2.p1  ORF type:complete len:334 (+),score=61.87 TRINITY_DN3731_c0_g1_i2:51-1052(+)